MSREMDAEIAEKVMGWQEFPYLLNRDDRRATPNSRGAANGFCPPGQCHITTVERVPDYSTDISAAFEVVQKMRERGFVTFGLLCKQDQVWFATFGGVTECGADAPQAICRASLAALAALKEGGGE